MIELDRRNKSSFNGFSDFTLEFAKDFYFSKRSEKWPTKMEFFFSRMQFGLLQSRSGQNICSFFKRKMAGPPSYILGVAPPSNSGA